MSEQSLRQAYEQPLLAARAYKQAGGKVVGYISTAVPTELIAASGAMPVLISGDLNRATPLADEWMESQFDPMVRSIFDMALAGELQFLDLLIVPRVADSFMRLYLYLREVERLELCKKLPKLLLFDFLQSQYHTSEEYNLARVAALRDELRKLCAHAITNEALHAAIVAANDNRQTLRELISLRNSGTTKGSDVLSAIGTRYLMSTEQHTKLVRKLVSSLKDGVTPAKAGVHPKDMDSRLRGNDGSGVAKTEASGQGIRVVVAGNAQDNTLLYEYLEAQGFHVVGDYHWLGDNCCARDIEVLGDPLIGITEHYQKYSLTSRRYPQSTEDLVVLAKAHQAQCVVFFLFEAEEALSWDVPNQSRALEKAGIPALIIGGQPYGPCIDAAFQEQLAVFKMRVAK